MSHRRVLRHGWHMRGAPSSLLNVEHTHAIHLRCHVPWPRRGHMVPYFSSRMQLTIPPFDVIFVRREISRTLSGRRRLKQGGPRRTRSRLASHRGARRACQLGGTRVRRALPRSTNPRQEHSVAETLCKSPFTTTSTSPLVGKAKHTNGGD
jgi:hypothetical protein